MPDLPWAKIREAQKLTQQNVADALGVSRTLVSYWESGARPMDGRWVLVVGYWDETLRLLWPLLALRSDDA